MHTVIKHERMEASQIQDRHIFQYSLCNVRQVKVAEKKIQAENNLMFFGRLRWCVRSGCLESPLNTYSVCGCIE